MEYLIGPPGIKCLTGRSKAYIKVRGGYNSEMLYYIMKDEENLL